MKVWSCSDQRGEPGRHAEMDRREQEPELADADEHAIGDEEAAERLAGA